MDIHGQHAHHLLLDRDRQRLLLDDFGGHHALLDRVAETSARWQALRRELDGLAALDTDRASRLDFLRFQLGELEGLEIGAGRSPSGSRPSSAGSRTQESILDGCRRTLERLEGDGGRSVAGLFDESPPGSRSGGASRPARR